MASKGKATKEKLMGITLATWIQKIRKKQVRTSTL